MMNIPAKIADRIRRPTPSGLSVLRGSLPVVAFGNPDCARVATLSLNPSWIEFESPSGEWLYGSERRLASLVSLGVDDPRNLDQDQIAQVLIESNSYFQGPNWYKAWFHWLEKLLAGSGAGSYLDGSACHLDLVQWATKPAQGKLPAKVWNRLVDQDTDFLHWQLRNSDVTTVLCNGASVVRWVQRAGFVGHFVQEVLVHRTTKGERTIRVFCADTDGVLFIGWNKPLAGAIASAGRGLLVEWVAGVIRERTQQAANEVGRVPNQKTVNEEIDLENGFVPIGTTVEGWEGLHEVLSKWIRSSTTPTVGDIGTFGGSPVIIVRMKNDEFVLNRDTKRTAVEAFLLAAAHAGGAANLRYHVRANVKGKYNRVSYLDDDTPTPGWFAYLRKPATESRDLH